MSEAATLMLSSRCSIRSSLQFSIFILKIQSFCLSTLARVVKFRDFSPFCLIFVNILFSFRGFKWVRGSKFVSCFDWCSTYMMIITWVCVYVLLSSSLVLNASVWNWSILVALSVVWLIMFKLRHCWPSSLSFFGLQKLKTRFIRKDVNPEWNEDLTLSIIDPNHQVKLVSGWICFFFFKFSSVQR